MADRRLTPREAGANPSPRWAEVNAAVLRANAAAITRHVAPSSGLMAMVKANAYGHGAVDAARAFVGGGATWLGVSSPEEALELREGGIEVPVLNVNWTHPRWAEALVAARVDMAVFDLEAVAAAAAAGSPTRRARVHLKVDTGMNRLGVPVRDVGSLVDALSQAAETVEIAGLFTHFADADGSDLAFTIEQNRRFNDVVAAVRPLAPTAVVHAANSAATLRLPDTHHDLVRCGIALYGYPPPHAGGVVALTPAMTVCAMVTHVKTVESGGTVGYGRLWTAPRATRIAIVEAGYADGVRRDQTNRGAVLLRGVRCPMIGRVSMDQVAVDVSATRDVEPGDVAVLFGPGELTADDVAAVSGTVSYEVLCAVSARVGRRTSSG